MEDRAYSDDKVQKMLERTVLVIISGYAVALLVAAQAGGWSVYVKEIICATLIAGWFMSYKGYRSFEYRTVFIAVIAWINFIIFAFHNDNFTAIIPVMAGLIILLSIFRSTRIVYLGMFVSNGLFLYYGFIAKTIPLSESSDVVRLVLQILSVYTASFTAWVTVRIRIQTSEKLYENIRSLESAEQSKDDFMVNISHEIRTPINAVCGMSEAILQEDIPIGVRKDVIDIQTAGRNLLSTVSNILDYSELESGELGLAEESYNITSTITDIINMALTLDNGRKLEFIVDCDANLPSNLVGDEQKIRRIVMNLLENAMKFTKEGGVVLRVRSRKEEYGVNLVISVRDSGIGIEHADMEKIFTRFSQVDSKRNREESGAGIGLAITKALVTKMGGFITVDSVPGIGSEFQFTIPQKVIDETPIVSIKNKHKLFVACYINMDKYNYSVVREGYENCISHMAEQFGIMFRTCKNLAELKRRMEHENYSHIFIGWEEYCEDRKFFEQLTKDYSVVLILDYGQEVRAGSNMLRIYKPFTVLSIAAVLNGGKVTQRDEQHLDMRHRFVAPSARVLVVDDNAMNLKVMARLLLPYQIKVTMAGSGQEALDKLSTMEFDCVFLDHMMPEMDGVETLHNIRQKPGAYFQKLSVIAFTANAIGGARDMFLAEGFNDFIAKPIELSVLERMLRRYIPVQKQIMLDDEVAGAEKTDGEQGPALETPSIRLQQEEADAMAETAAAEEGDIAEEGAFEALREAGVDVEQGISYCGDREGFREIATMYHQDGAKRREKLELLFDQEDWKNYTIYVHALKSNSKGIGANELSELALKLEMAGKENRIEEIRENHAVLIKRHDELLDALSENSFLYPSKGMDVPENSETAQEQGEAGAAEESPAEQEQPLEQQLALLREKLEGFEADGLDVILNNLAAYSLPDDEGSLSEVTEQIREKVGDFDFLGAQELLDQWEEKRKG